MLSLMEIKVNQQNPNVPLQNLTTFVNSGITLQIMGVDSKMTEVYVEISYDDGFYSKQATKSNNIWICTLPSSGVVGQIEDGYSIKCKDSSGTTYTIGSGDVIVLSVVAQSEDDENVTILRLHEEEPENPNEGDVYFEDDNMKVYEDDDWKDAYALPTALSSRLGGIKVGNTLSCSSDGTLNVKESGLKIASYNTTTEVVIGMFIPEQLSNFPTDADIVYANIEIQNNSYEDIGFWYYTVSSFSTAVEKVVPANSSVHFIGLIYRAYYNENLLYYFSSNFN